MSLSLHQYIDRDTGRICSERPLADGIINYLYAKEREDAGIVFRLLGSPWLSTLLGWVNYDLALGRSIPYLRRFLRECSVDMTECLEGQRGFRSARALFERQIRYWHRRPMADDRSAIVSPADSRVLVGSLAQSSWLFLKGKFFEPGELVGAGKQEWAAAFRDGDSVICRLTPDKYHYNHSPVAGVVRDFYETDGGYQSCNPGAVITLASPYSKNKRTVTVIDTDVDRGTGVGIVAMVEVVALMIGDIVQCYSRHAYDQPGAITPGMFLEKGCPKSLFRPGSSTTVLLFQKDRIEFCDDLIRNLKRSDIASRYSQGLGVPLVETDIKVRATIGYRKGARP